MIHSPCTRTPRRAFQLGVVIVLGCNNSQGTSPCANTLTAYCTSAPCVMHVDFNNAAASYCSASPAMKDFGLAQCSDGGVGQVLVTTNANTYSSQLIFQYDPSGQLVAVFDLELDGSAFVTTCLGGASSNETIGACKSGLVGNICQGDAGTD